MTDEYPDVRADERTTLEQFLDQYRRTVAGQIADLDSTMAAAQVLPATDLTVGGLVKHLAHTEDMWFTVRLAGDPLPEPWASAPLADEPDWAFRSATGDDVATVRDLYRAACDRSRAAAGRCVSLDTLAAVPSFGRGPVSLRWITVHMIEETARHAGHVDLLRDALFAS